MNAFYTALYNHFSSTTDSGFYNDISGRLYYGHAPQEATFPYCVYFPVVDVHDEDFTDDREEFTIQFDIFSQNNSATEAGNLLESLKTMFDNCSLTVTDWRHIYFQRETILSNNSVDRDPKIHGYTVQYEALIEKTK